jgi:hypothetical protein
LDDVGFFPDIKHEIQGRRGRGGARGFLVGVEWRDEDEDEVFRMAARGEMVG